MTPDSHHGDRQPGGSTSRSLLEEARRDAGNAWERLVGLYAPLVAWWCRRWGVAEQDVADILQDVFSAVAGHLDQFRNDRPTDTFRGWLLTIARNKVRDHRRAAANQTAAVGGTEAYLRLNQIAATDVRRACEREPPGTEPATDGIELFDRVLHAALQMIRGEFQERTWQAFWGVTIEGRATADVAADLGMQPGAVRVAKSRVLQRLRRELGDQT